MTPRLKITYSVIERLHKEQANNKPTTGCLFGLMYDSTLLVVGFNIEVCTDDSDDTSHCYTQLNLNFPTEIDLCGLVTFKESTDNEDVTFEENAILQDVEITDNPLLLSCYLGGTVMKAHLQIHGKFEEINFEIINENELWKQFTHVRLETRIPLVCELERDSIRAGLQALRKKVASGMVSFRFRKSDVYLMSSDPDEGLSGLTGEPTIAEMGDTTLGPAEVPSSKKKKQDNKNMGILHVEMLLKLTRDSQLEPANKSAPVIQHIKRSFQCLNMLVPVDTLSMVHRDTKVVRLYGVLIDSVCRSLRLTERDLSRQMDCAERAGKMAVAVPELFHFFPPECGHFITLAYQRGRKEDELKLTREILHKEFGLPMTRPYFRRANKYLFRDELSPDQPLINPHEGLGPSGVKGGEVSLVQGLYSYHHYMQDRTNDDGWGCAYRSLQTLVSWFRWQGYNDTKIPTHREIQQCLVDIGDKPSSFVGTKQWIGSTEVGFVLETLLGATSRVLSVSSGEELGSRGGELEAHFKTQGTPVMVGGGVLAHTILGVDFNRQTGELKFLILDPHYTGGEDLGLIQSKGWCGWKGVNFWVKTAYYNLCLPQRPRCI